MSLLEIITVKDLIEVLRTKNPDAVVCSLEIQHNESIYSSFEVCKEFNNVTYINDKGDEEKGDVVCLY